MISSIAAAASSPVRSCAALQLFDQRGKHLQLQEIAQQLPALAGQHRLGVELHAVDRATSRCRTPMIVPSSVRAATSSASGSRLGDDQRVIAPGLERLRRRRERRRARRAARSTILPCISCGARTTSPPNATPMP